MVIDTQIEPVVAVPISAVPKWRAYWSLGGVLLLLVLLLIGVMGCEPVVSFLSSAMASTADRLFADDFENGDAQWNTDSDDWSIQVDERGNHFYC
jgi:hypothetical protein